MSAADPRWPEEIAVEGAGTGWLITFRNEEIDEVETSQREAEARYLIYSVRREDCGERFLLRVEAPGDGEMLTRWALREALLVLPRLRRRASARISENLRDHADRLAIIDGGRAAAKEEREQALGEREKVGS